MWQDFHFLMPYWLLLLLVIPLVVWLLSSARRSAWQQWLDPVLAPFVLTETLGKRSYWQPLIACLIWTLAVLALAGPAWQKQDVPVYNNPHALVLGLDLSASMWAKDVDPDRLSRARFKLLDILAKRRDGQTALVVFAGDAFVVTPLTSDTVTIAEQIKNLSPDIMPATGSHLTPAIQQARQLLKQANFPHGDVLLITDGVDDSAEAQQSAKAGVAQGYYISTLAIGTEQGAPIALPDGDFLRDQQGKTIIPVVNHADISAVSQAGKGLSLTASVNDQDLEALYEFWSQHITGLDPQAQNQHIELWVNQGYWLLLPLVLLLMGVFRKGWLVLLVIGMVSLKPQPVMAFEWQSAWKTPDQQAEQAMQAKQFKEAAQQFNNPDWKAAAAYEAGQYEAAAAWYKDQTSAQGQYNYGNALAKQGQLEQALKAYDKALAAKTDYAQALKNRQIVEQALKQQQQNQQSKQDQQAKQDQKQPQQDSANSASSDQQSPQQGESGQSDSPQQGQGKQDSDNQQDNATEQEKKATDHAQESAKDERKPAQQRPKSQSPNPAQSPSKPDGSDSDLPDQKDREQQQATEQWLRRIPDDPAGLWRRKFYYQYQQRSPQQQGVAW